LAADEFHPLGHCLPEQFKNSRGSREPSEAAGPDDSGIVPPQLQAKC
jgi:hypothetical protein